MPCSKHRPTLAAHTRMLMQHTCSSIPADRKGDRGVVGRGPKAQAATTAAATLSPDGALTPRYLEVRIWVVQRVQPEKGSSKNGSYKGAMAVQLTKSRTYLVARYGDSLQKQHTRHGYVSLLCSQ
jgi:hypothetical protein